MVYFAQEVGEPGDGNAGFGSETRTTIYDYWGVPNQVRWMNGGAFDGGLLDQEEKELREFYRTLLNFCLNSRAITGTYREIHSFNRANAEWYNDRVFSFVRWKDEQRLIIVCNFDANETYGFNLQVPPEIMEAWNLQDGIYTLEGQLQNRSLKMEIAYGVATIRVELQPLESMILKLPE